MRGVRELEDGRVIIADGFDGAVIVWTPGVGADTLTKLQGDRRSIGRRTASSPCLMAARSFVDLGNARLTRIEVDLSFGETWSIAQGAPGTGLAMISPVGTDRTGGIYFRQRLGGMTGMSDSVNGPARFRLFARFSRYSSTAGPIMASRQEG